MKKPAMCSWAVRIGLGLLAWSVLLSGLVGVGMAGGPTEPTVAPKEREMPAAGPRKGELYRAVSSSAGAWWVWTNPLPVGVPLFDVDVTPSGSVFAVGKFGAILRYDPDTSRWELFPRPPDEFLYGVWAYNDQRVFAVGVGENGGLILSYDGSSWQRVETGNNNTLFDVWGTSPSNVFAVGLYGTILHYDGSKWTPMQNVPASHLYAVWGTSANQVYAAGYWGVVIRYDGTKWVQVFTGTWPINDLWGGSETDVYAPANDGFLFHYDGSTWSDVSPDRGGDFTAVWGRASNHLYVVSNGYMKATLYRYDGITWTQAITVPQTIRAISGTPSGTLALYGVGEQGYVFRYDGTKAEELSYGAREDILDIWGFSDGEAFAAGRQGTLLRYDGDRWTRMVTNTTKDLYAIWGSAKNNLFAVGEGGTILHYDGSAWSPMNSGTTANFRGVWGTSPTNVIAVGNNGTVRRYDGRVWSPMNSGSTYDLVDVWGQGDQFFAVEVNPDTDKGTVLRYDGKTWTRVDIGATGPLYAVWGTSPNNVFVTASGNVLFHYDGQQWVKIPTRTPTLDISADWYAVWGRSANEVYIAGRSAFESHLMRYDGQQFAHIPMPHNEDPYGMWGTDNWVFVAGGGGTIVRYGSVRSYLPLVLRGP